MLGADFWTDYRLIRSQLSMRVRPPAHMKQPCKRLNTNALLSEVVRGNFQRTLHHQLEELSKPSQGPSDGPTLTAEWESITDTILSTTKSTLGIMHKRHQDWFDASWKEIHLIPHEKTLPTRLTFSSLNSLLIINDGSGFVPKSNTICARCAMACG